MPIRRSPNGVRHVRPQPGRDRPEWVVAINRNAWSQSVGTGGRNHPVRSFCIRPRVDLPVTLRVPGDLTTGGRSLRFHPLLIGNATCGQR
jgi:hypothetical protein